MVKMGHLTKHILWHTNCNRHTVNLLAKDISDLKITKNVNIVLKEFKQPEFEKRIIFKQGHCFKLPCETRQCSNKDIYLNLVNNLPFMKAIVAENKGKKVTGCN